MPAPAWSNSTSAARPRIEVVTSATVTCCRTSTTSGRRITTGRVSSGGALCGGRSGDEILLIRVGPMDAAEVYLARPPPEAIEEQLKRPIKAVVGTLNPDGSIHLAFVLFLWEEGRFYFETASMTKKVRNLRDRPTASFAIDPPGFMAMAEGIGRIIERGEAHAINRRLRQKYLTAEAVETIGAAWGTVGDVAVEITPHRWRSWSNEMLRELSSEAAGDLPPERWWISE